MAIALAIMLPYCPETLGLRTLVKIGEYSITQGEITWAFENILHNLGTRIMKNNIFTKSHGFSYPLCHKNIPLTRGLLNPSHTHELWLSGDITLLQFPSL
jgi:hypothetical protein